MSTCRSFLGLVLLMAMLGCQSPASVTCANGTVCREGFVCTPTGGCALPEQLVACEGKADDTACTLTTGEGFCKDEVCRVAQCGNGRLDSEEACDDGNTASGDGCRADCRKVEVCGDAEVDSGEDCDDGNANAVDGCDACQNSTWDTEVLLGGSSAARTLSTPNSMVADAENNLFISMDRTRQVVRVDAKTGAVTVVAGNGEFGFSGDGGNATEAALGRPFGLAVDGLGNLFITDGDNFRIRRVDSQSGIITTVAGNGTFGFSGDGGNALQAQLAAPRSVVVDGLGNLFIADTVNHRIRRVDGQTDIITTIAGSTPGFSGDDGPAIDAELAVPGGLTMDNVGNLFIAVGTGHIRRIDAQTGFISTVAGNGNAGAAGDGSPATNAELSNPQDVAVDEFGNLFIADTGNHRIRRVDAETGVITTLTGSDAGFSGDGGAAVDGQLNGPVGVAVDRLGNVLIADLFNHRVRRVELPSSMIDTIAGNGSDSSIGDGTNATATALPLPLGVTVDHEGNLLISSGNRIRRVDVRSGIISTIAGSEFAGFSGDGGSALSAQLNTPKGLAVDQDGNLFVADVFNHSIRRIDALTGIITSVAGDGTSGFSGDGDEAANARLNEPDDIAMDAAGNIFIGDLRNNRVRQINPQGIISTIAGGGSNGLGDDGLAIEAELAPAGLVVDAAGDLLIADRQNNRIRKVDSQNRITTVAGGGFSTADGINALDAQLNGLSALAVDGLGNIFIIASDRIHRVDAQGIITMVAGNGSGEDGTPAVNAGLNFPRDMATDAQGNLFITGGDHVRRVDAQSAIITTVAGSVFPSGLGLAPDARLAVPQAMVTAGPVSFFAGGTTGTVQQFASEDGILDSVVGRNLRVFDRSILAQYQTPSFGTVGGVAYNEADGLIYLSETSKHQIQVVSTNDSARGIVPSDSTTWTIEILAGFGEGFLDASPHSSKFREPMGLLFEETTRQLYVADRGNHAIRAIDIDGQTVTTIAGTPETLGFFGDTGDALGALLFGPTTMTRCPNGDVFIADTANNRIRRVEAGTSTITTVTGVGVAASSGEGTPARNFPIDEPRGLVCDDAGNLFITSRTTIRLLPANDAGVVDGTGAVQTIYGTQPRDTFPSSVTNCLTGIAIIANDNGATMLQATDSCTGILIELTRSR